MKILIADDQASLHQYLDGIIDWNSLGFQEVFHAFNGEEALELLMSKKPDMLVLDIEMPKMSGIDVLKQLNTSNLPIPKTIILSAFNEFEYAQNAIELDVKKYILKPVDEQELILAITTFKKELQNENTVSLQKTIQHLLVSGKSEIHLNKLKEYFTQLHINKYKIVYIKSIEGKHPRFSEKTFKKYNPIVIPLNETELFLFFDESKHPIIEEELACLLEKQSKSFVFFAGSSPCNSNADQLIAMAQLSKDFALMGFYDPNTVHTYQKNQTLFCFDKDSDTSHFLKNLLKGIEFGYIKDTDISELKVVLDGFKKKLVLPAYVKEYVNSILDAVNSALANPTRQGSALPLKDVTFDTMKKTVMEALEHLQKQNMNSSNKIQQIEKVKQYIDECYNEPLSLQLLADQFHIDKYQLSKLFKAQFSLNLWAYVTKVRMEKAAELLSHTDLKIYQICEKIGLEEESHFSNVFKKHFGISPKKYRDR